MGVHVVWLGCLIGAITVGVGAWAWGAVTVDGEASGADIAYVSTLVFTTLALLQLGRVQAARSFTQPVVAMDPFGNPTLLAMVGLAFVLQMLTVFLPAAQPFFQTIALGAEGLLVGAAAAAVVLVVAEIEKAVRRRRAAQARARA